LKPSAWLKVPLADYEGHMRAEQVAQLSVLSDLFAEVLEACQPESVAVLGIAGGNGLERLDPGVTRRILGVDINAQYLDAVRERFGNIFALELHCADLAESAFLADSVDLVHAALVFEHAGVGQCLLNARNLVKPHGHMAVVLQLPSASSSGVGETGFASMQLLAADFQLVDPEWMTAELQATGFTRRFEVRRAVAGGKALWLGLFQRV